MTMHERTGFASVLGGLVLAVFLLFLANAESVSAAVPSAVPFQGLLLDTAGQPVTDHVDLDFALYQALSGGTALWSESHLGVAVTDGVYSVNLGSTTPIDAAVLAAGPVFLEIKVEGETLVPRQQLLAVPYARVAETVQNVGGYSSLYLEQMIAGYAFDGGLPANTDPSEGTGDADGDGTPNFLDADNDNDGFPDTEEVTAGSNVNLPGPRLVSVTPNTLTSYVSASLLVQGTNLSTVQSVQFGSASPTPTDITATSFRIQVTPDHLAPSRAVVATVANGESGQSPSVTITNLTPFIFSVAPTFLVQMQATQLVIQGANFVAGTIVEADSLSLVPSAITPTSITVTIPPRPVGVVLLRVVHPDTLSASTTLPVFGSTAPKTVFLTQATFGGNVGGLAGADATCQAEATAATLPGSYHAWLSDSTTAAASRVGVSTGPYRMPNGVFVAGSWTDLTDGSLLAGINVLANGTVVPGSGRVWTATHNDGTAYTAAADNCNNWTSNGGTGGRSGLFNTTNVWTDFAPSSPCSTSGIRLYCFEQ